MDIEVRGVEPEGIADYWRVLYTAFAEDLTDERIDDEALRAEQDRMLGAFDGDRIIGTAGAYSFELTLPGGATVPVAGVTSVAVLPTHRRRGVLRAMMDRQLTDVAERREPVAVLTASEAGIYGRFGYGVAARTNLVRMDTRGGLPTVVEPRAAGRLRFAEDGEIATALPSLLDRVRRTRVGELSRPAGFWEFIALDREHRRDGATAFQTVVHEDVDGDVDGAVRYRVKQGEWAHAEVVVDDLLAADPEVEAALVRFAADIDLTVTLTAHRPVDDPVPYRLADWRRYQVKETIDHLYVRVLDVEGALAARTYRGTGTVTLAVDDPFRPAGAGTYRLAVDDRGVASCERVSTDPDDGAADLRLDVSALGSAFLGDAAPSTLAAAGRLAAASPEALALADRLFVEPVRPFCSLEF